MVVVLLDARQRSGQAPAWVVPRDVRSKKIKRKEET
jgi:hypothetical protein